MVAPKEPARGNGETMQETPEAPSERAALEAGIRAACEAGNPETGVTLLLQLYGDELLSFLVARLGDRSHADEAFSMLAEDLWLGLPKFEFRSSVRTWAYTVTRHAAARYVRTPARRKDRNLTLSNNVRLSQLVDQVRSRTEVYRRSEVKDRVRALRERLEPDDQMLLILRVDRQMPWRDLALVMCGGDDPSQPALDDAAVDRESARLRKRFERVKTELKRLAQEAGLLP